VIGPPARGYAISEFVDETNNLFSSVANNPMLRDMDPYRERKRSGVQMVNVRRNLGGTLIAMGWPSPSAGQENMTLQVIKEMLTMKNGILEPLKRTPLPKGLGTLVGDVGMEVNAYNYPDTMFLLASVPCSPQSEAVKLNFSNMALIQAIASLYHFDDQKMLNVALKKIKHQHAIMSETLNGRMDLIERGVLASNLDNCKPWWFLDYDTTFSSDRITIESIRQAAADYMNQNNLVTVNLLQNELNQTKSCTNIKSIPFSLDNNAHVQLDENGMAVLNANAFERDETGICMSQKLLPQTRCVAVFNYHVPNATSSWATRKVVPELFNEFGKGREAAALQNIDIAWESSFNDIIVTVKCDKNDVDQAMKLYAEMLKNPFFTKQNLFMAVSKLAASTNSMVHDTKKQCEVAVRSTIFDDSSPMYAQTAQERIDSMHNLNGQDISNFIKAIIEAPTQVGTINYSQQKRQQVIDMVCKNLHRSVPAEFDKTTNLSDKKVLFCPVESSESFTMKIGQPIHNVDGTDNRSLAKLVVANKIMSNSFNGRLMRKLRTEKSLTYGASSFIESKGANPVMLMTASFSPENVQAGMRESRIVLNDFCRGNFTEKEFNLAKNTAISIYRTFGTDMEYVESRLKNMLSVDNPYEIAADIKTIMSCSYADVKDLINNSMRPDDFKIVYSGPHIIE